MGSPKRPVFKVRNQKPKKKNKDAKERITCTCPCPCCTCKSPCSSSSTCTCTCTSSSSIPPSPSSCSSTCSCSSPSSCSSCSCSPSPTRPDGPDGLHRWWSRCWLCRGPRRRQRHHWHVLWWLLTSTSTCPCTHCSCTSCTCSRAKRANWTVRLGDQAVPTVQPGSVRHHPLRRVQRGAQRMQAEEPDDSLDFQDLRIFSPLSKSDINSAGQLTESPWCALVIDASFQRPCANALCILRNKFIL